jgi:amino acid transporter
MATEMPTQTGVFTRASSGLVRQVKTVDVMSYGIQQIALSYIVFIVLVWGLYPGASMPLASLIATIAGLAMGVCYAMFATLYPRSGGEYVYLSRTLHPAVGFTVSFSFAFWETFYTGINGAFFSLYSVSPFLAALGLQANSQTLLNWSTWFAGKWGIFIGGSVMIIFLTILQILGAGVYFKWQRWATYLALGSIVVTLIVLFLGWTGVLDFKAHLNDVMGAGTYQKVVADGIAGGVAPAAGFNFGETMKFMIWPAFSIWFAVASTSFSGEIKNVQRSQLIVPRSVRGQLPAVGIRERAPGWIAPIRPVVHGDPGRQRRADDHHELLGAGDRGLRHGDDARVLEPGRARVEHRRRRAGVARPGQRAVPLPALGADHVGDHR